MVISLQDPTIGKGLNRKEPILIREGQYMPKDKFMIAGHYQKDIESIMISKGMIVDRVEKLAMDIRNTYGDEPLHILCVLKGARSFFTELCGALGRIHKYSGSFRQPPYVSFTKKH
jgi:hypoxanthine phosphoribosyltransferase